MKRRLPPLPIRTSAALAAAMAASLATASGRYDLSWHTIDGGGIQAAGGGTFVLSGTIGQPDAGGPLTGGTYSLVGGFWTVEATNPAPCPEDLDASGAVDAADLAVLLGNWGSPGLGDLDGNGVVDGGDLGLMLSLWS